MRGRAAVERMSTRRTVRLVALLGLALAAVAGCAEPRRPPPLPPPLPTPTAPVYEEIISPPRQLRLEIIDVREQVSAGGDEVTITGTIMNRGDRPTSRLSVQVNALDEAGQPVLSLSAVPSTDRIAPHGGTATFRATLPNRPDVVRYHVEAIGR